jgi:hypothetical protein
MEITKILYDTPENRGLFVSGRCYTYSIRKLEKVSKLERVKMTTLAKTQYLLTWVGSNMGWTGTIQALCESETKAWDYLSQKVLEGWVVLETTLEEVK